MPRSRIICTIGPSSSSLSVLERLIHAGMGVARFNFSHGTHAEHGDRIRLLRKAAKKAGRPIRVLQDLEGYRIRVGHFKEGGGIRLRPDDRLRLTTRAVLGKPGLIPFDYLGSLVAIRTGAQIFIDDGNIELVVLGHAKDGLDAQVVTGGFLKQRKGVNIPGFRAPFEGLTEKDERDLAFGLECGVEWIAQSFVRDEGDMARLRALVKENGSKQKLVAKIENNEGLCNLEAILSVSDGIMVARGDLGVSIPIYEIPMAQKMIIKECNRKKKFVITATQMLESMNENPRPTRAEVGDVANAILDGSDFVMLSGETAAGKYPVLAVEMMKSVIDFTEKHAKEGAFHSGLYCRL